MFRNPVAHYNQCEPAEYIKQLVLYGTGQQAEKEENSLMRKMLM